jgi:ribosomal-protein-alanine N-acetyltransferase
MEASDDRQAGRARRRTGKLRASTVAFHRRAVTGPAAITIRPLGEDADARLCARLMAGSEPWITLGRGYEESLAILRDPARESYVARLGAEIVGFVVLSMAGAFVGYIQTVCVAPEHQGRGFGSALVGFAEERIWRESPNVFLCVSDFNGGARRLYERLGYRVVGELNDYIVAGHSEILMRKSLGPLSTDRGVAS